MLRRDISCEGGWGAVVSFCEVTMPQKKIVERDREWANLQRRLRRRRPSHRQGRKLPESEDLR